MRFWKGEALGNDYVVVDATGSAAPTAEEARQLCDRHRGVGADGVLVADLSTDPVGLRIINPDGGEAEKSGNGLRIFGAWLHHEGHVGEERFTVDLPAEAVALEVVGEGGDGTLVIRVDMGRASFRAGDIPFDAVEPDAEVLGRPLDLEGGTVEVYLVSLGNPHCVVLADPLDVDEFRRLAPAIQAVPAFADGVNVQFARPLSPSVVEARVWERGAGETTASGTSACAVACVAHRLGLTASTVEVRMPGGSVSVEVESAEVRLTGEARMVFRGETL